jgi:hypothetical protein
MKDVTVTFRISEDMYNHIDSFRAVELFEQTLVRVLENGLDVMVSRRVDEQIENDWVI